MRMRFDERHEYPIDWKYVCVNSEFFVCTVVCAWWFLHGASSVQRAPAVELYSVYARALAHSVDPTWPVLPRVVYRSTYTEPRAHLTGRYTACVLQVHIRPANSSVDLRRVAPFDHAISLSLYTRFRIERSASSGSPYTYSSTRYLSLARALQVTCDCR